MPGGSASFQRVNASPIRTRHWTRAEYYRLDELGIFHPDERLELVGGQIVVKERQSPAHATAIMLAIEALEHAFGPGWHVRTRATITLDEENQSVTLRSCRADRATTCDLLPDSDPIRMTESGRVPG